MTESQEIKMNRIIKKLEDAKKELKGLASDQTFPLNVAEYAQVDSALRYVEHALMIL